MIHAIKENKRLIVSIGVLLLVTFISAQGARNEAPASAIMVEGVDYRLAYEDNADNYTNCDYVQPGDSGIFDVTDRLTSQEWEDVVVTTDIWGMYSYDTLANGGGPIVDFGDEVCLLPDGRG